MAGSRKVSESDLIHMIKDQQLTYPEIAHKTGLTVSGVNQAVRRLRRRGQLEPSTYTKHEWPWKLIQKHLRTRVYQYLASLSRLSQGQELPPETTNTAIRWAQALVDQKLDVDYDANEPPNEFNAAGGFKTVPATPDNWYLKDLLDRAKAGMLKKPL